MVQTSKRPVSKRSQSPKQSDAKRNLHSFSDEKYGMAPEKMAKKWVAWPRFIQSWLGNGNCEKPAKTFFLEKAKSLFLYSGRFILRV